MQRTGFIGIFCFPTAVTSVLVWPVFSFPHCFALSNTRESMDLGGTNAATGVWFGGWGSESSMMPPRTTNHTISPQISGARPGWQESKSTVSLNTTLTPQLNLFTGYATQPPIQLGSHRPQGCEHLDAPLSASRVAVWVVRYDVTQHVSRTPPLFQISGGTAGLNCEN